MVGSSLYFDRAAKVQDGIMCVAAAMYKKGPYRRFRREWDGILRPWGAKAFHATDFYTGAKSGEFYRKNEDGTPHKQRTELFEQQKRDIPRIIATHCHQLFVVSFKIPEFEVVAPDIWKERFGTLHGVAAQMLAGGVGHWCNRYKYNQPIEYVIESGQDGTEMEQALRGAYDKPELRRHNRMAGYPAIADKGTERGLEVADFIGWHWNKFYVDRLAATEPRRVRDDLSALLGMAGDKIHVALLTGSGLEDFLLDNGCARRQR